MGKNRIDLGDRHHMCIKTFVQHGTGGIVLHVEHITSFCIKTYVQPGTRGLVLHVEPITCGQEDATGTEHGLPRYSCDVVVESYIC